MRRLGGLLFLIVGTAVWAGAQAAADPLILQPPRSGSSGSIPSALSTDEDPAFHRLALGISYLGGQIRWRFSRKWAAEYQYQHGKASSDYGDVTADVFGLRGYRFFRTRGRLPLYVGSEIAYAQANTNASNYRTSGVVIGVFAGFDYYFAKRLSLGLDLGPYVISLKEKQTGMSQTNLDFVLNTTLNWHLF